MEHVFRYRPDTDNKYMAMYFVNRTRVCVWVCLCANVNLVDDKTDTNKTQIINTLIKHIFNVIDAHTGGLVHTRM